MAKADGTQGALGPRSYNLTDAQIARKRSLDIPVHLTSADCTFDFNSGYCICGQMNPKWQHKNYHLIAREDRPTSRMNIDNQEGNWEQYR